MKKILIGICGIGNGHENRQKCIIDELLKYNIEIILAISNNKWKTFNKIYPNLKKVEICIPWIVCDEQGVNFKKTLSFYKDNDIDQYQKFLEFGIEVEKKIGGIPDLVISDYEPNVAQFAYAINKPLLCFEQQSKFLYLNKEINRDIIQKYSINEEISRLNYFFPKVDMRIISSFFPIDSNDKKIFVTQPIIGKMKKKETIKNKALVYFSPYTQDKKNFIKILNLIKLKKDIMFVVYTELIFNEYLKFPNISFKNFNDDFKLEMANCEFIISSSGHQIISEAIYLEKPLYLFPLDTYEQNYNCEMVEKYKLGFKIKNYDLNELNFFLKKNEEIINNMKTHKKKYWRKNWRDTLKIVLQKNGIEQEII